MKTTRLKYSGSIGWLIAWAILLPPVALVLLIVNLRLESK